MAVARYFLQLDGAINGPYRADQVHDLVVGQVIHARTPVAPSAEGPWLPLADVPELAGSVARRPAVAAFKPGEVEMINERGAKGVDLREVIAAAQVRGPVLGGYARGSAPPASAAAGALNDVQELVRAVQATEAKFAPPPPLPPKRRVRRSTWVIAVLWVAMLLVALGLRLGYADRWNELATSILGGWLVLGHGFLVALHFVFRRTEDELR